jgi:hypothetical protein
MNALDMPPLAVIVDDEAIQSLVLPLSVTEVEGGRIYEIAPIWVAKVSGN